MNLHKYIRAYMCAYKHVHNHVCMTFHYKTLYKNYDIDLIKIPPEKTIVHHNSSSAVSYTTLPQGSILHHTPPVQYRIPHFKAAMSFNVISI